MYLSAIVLHAAVAGYMSAGSSMYSDTWGDSSSGWEYGQFVGRMNIHKYASITKRPPAATGLLRLALPRVYVGEPFLPKRPHTFGVYIGACSAVVKATYPVLVVNGLVDCSPVGLVQTVDKAGPCT